MKIVQSTFRAVVMALFFASTVHAQNVGIGFPSPQSKLTVNGNFAIGADYNAVAPTNGALIEGTVGIGTKTPNSGSQLHIYSPDQALELIEAGGGVNGNWADLRLQMDAGTNHHTVIEMTNTDTSNGFQLWSDPSNDNSNDFAIYDLAAKTWRIWLDPSGNVGIGTTTPRAPLDVPNFTTVTETGGVRTFFDYATTPQLTQQNITTTTNVTSAIFGQCVFTANAFISYGGAITASDARLKNVIGRSDSKKDLETLRQIQVTDYTMKDIVTFGGKPMKKVIAQQVEQVYPTAVSTVGVKRATFIPNIYVLSKSVRFEKPDTYTVKLSKAHQLTEGDTVRLIIENNREVDVVVHVVDDKSFMVTSHECLGEKVFVYGKQCLDLKTVDYDAISMLNVSATQELANKVDLLEHENENLKAEVAELRAANQKLTKIATDIESLKRAVATIQEKKNEDIRAVALEQ
jgi:Chaperone of endosialidase